MGVYIVGLNPGFQEGSVLFRLTVVKEANGDRRRKMDGEVINLFTHYEIDDDTSAHVLTLDVYGGEGTGSWVLLDPELE